MRLSEQRTHHSYSRQGNRRRRGRRGRDHKPLVGPTISAEDSAGTIFNTPVSDIQENLTISNGRITGTLNLLDSGDIANYWGNGYFVALKFANTDGVAPENITVAGTPLDSDLNGVWMVGKINEDTTIKRAEKLTVVTTDGEHTLTQDYDLSGLIFKTN